MFDRVIALSETHLTFPKLPPYNVLVVYDIPLKCCSCRRNGFRSRGSQPNIFIMINWGEDKQNTTGVDDTRAIPGQLIKKFRSTAEKQPTVTENEGYLNCRMCEISGTYCYTL